MLDERKIKVIGLWLLDLLDMTKGGREPPTPHKISLYTEGLAEMFPVGAFTKASLRAVVFEQEFFPAFDIVRTRVRQWWNENKPTAGLLIGMEGGPALSDMDQCWVNYFYRRRGELQAAVGLEERIANLASLIRAQSPKGWMSIIGEREMARRSVSEAERAAVHAAVASIGKGGWA